MLKNHEYVNLRNIFIFVLLCSTIISAYIFIDILICHNAKYKDIFNTWQFPMLLALTIEVIYTV